ncbi:MAG: GNAT family N-acetyltransferase [Nocardioidaceae bacterium]
MSDLETDRIRVRMWRDDEADLLLEILGDFEIAKWLGVEPDVMADRAEALQRIARYRELSAGDPRFGFWAVEVRQTGIPAGSVLLQPLPNGDGEIEIGWHLHRDAHGQGYASEAARLVLAKAFADGLPEVYAVTHTTNEASQRVCERIGMTDLGVVRTWYDAESQCFRITREEWAALVAP